MSAELPRTAKVVTVWLVLGTLLFLAVQAYLAQRERTRIVVGDLGEITLQRGPDGHFHWPGRIDGRAVEFLVDTGATRSALPESLARQLRLTPGRAVRSSTAGGTVLGWETQVDLQLEGGLQADRLRVTVLPSLTSPLLGMDVLSRLHFSQQGGLLRISPPSP